MNIKDLLEKSKGQAHIYKNLYKEIEKEITPKLIVVIPDMHLLEKDPNDDFFDGNEQYITRFNNFLNFIYDLKQELDENMEVIQVGDMFDLWQARGNVNLIQAVQEYTQILGMLDAFKTTYVIGNHDIDLWEWYKKQEEKFNRIWRALSRNQEGKITAIYEHGFQADFYNNQDSWSGAFGKEITVLVGYAEYLVPDIDIILGEAWKGMSRMFSGYNGSLTYNKNPDAFHTHEYTDYYSRFVSKYNRGETEDEHDPAEITLAVIGHTHRPRLVKRSVENKPFYLLDTGSWVNGGHEFGLVTEKEIALCQWG